MTQKPMSIFEQDGGHYNILKNVSMETLKTVFPEGEANEINFVLFSTSGVYTTIEEIEERLNGDGVDKYGEPISTKLTTLVIHPRLVSMMYSEVEVTLKNVAYLKKLRDTSKKVVMSIGGTLAFDATVEALKEQNKELAGDLLLSVEEKCAKYYIQDCMNCLNIDCCDNMNPLKKHIKEHIKESKK